MSIEQLTGLFQWMLIINIGLFALSCLVVILCKDMVEKMHGQMFGLEGRDIRIAIYAFLGAYKIFIIVFNLSPYIALRMLS